MNSFLSNAPKKNQSLDSTNDINHNKKQNKIERKAAALLGEISETKEKTERKKLEKIKQKEQEGEMMEESITKTETEMETEIDSSSRSKKSSSSSNQSNGINSSSSENDNLISSSFFSFLDKQDMDKVEDIIVNNKGSDPPHFQ